MSCPDQRIPTADAPRRRVRLIQAVFAGAATIATLALVGGARSDAGASVAAPRPAHSVGYGGFAADDPSNPGYTPPPVNTQSQPDPGWNADPGWDFQPSP